MKKKVLIILVILTIIIIGTVGGYFGYTYYEESKTTGTDWGDTYYTYLKSATNEKNNKEEYGLKEGMENTEIQFIDVGETNPVMIMTYDYEKKPFVNIYRSKEKDNVDKIVLQEPATVEFLYNIEDKSYAWYIHEETETEDSYKKIYTMLENSNLDNEVDYKIEKEDKTTQETLSGEVIELSKFDEIFVKIDVEVNSQIDFTEGINIKDLKKDIVNSIEKYKQQDEFITEEIKTAVESKIAEIEEIKQQIETAKNEIIAEEQRKAEEEATKQKAETENTIQNEAEKIYEDSRQTTSENSRALDEVEKITFNQKFTKYEGTKIKGNDVKTLINAVKSNNQSNQDKQVSLTGNIKEATEVSMVKTYTVKCIYDSNGFVNEISINVN